MTVSIARARGWDGSYRPTTRNHHRGTVSDRLWPRSEPPRLLLLALLAPQALLLLLVPLLLAVWEEPPEPRLDPVAQRGLPALALAPQRPAQVPPTTAAIIITTTIARRREGARCPPCPGPRRKVGEPYGRRRRRGAETQPLE